MGRYQKGASEGGLIYQFEIKAINPMTTGKGGHYSRGKRVRETQVIEIRIFSEEGTSGKNGALDQKNTTRNLS